MEPQTRSPPQSFPQFCKSANVVQFFRAILKELKEQNIVNYRLKITPTENSFEVRISHNKPQKHGPRTFEYCLSCDPDRARICDNNYPGGESAVIGGKTPITSLPEALRTLTSADCEWNVKALLGDVDPIHLQLVRIWLDAQARPLMIITPTRHVGGEQTCPLLYYNHPSPSVQ